MNSIERVLTLDDGATTTVEQWGERGPVMLCVHGMSSSRRSWTRFAEHYADRYRVLAYDQRGHGDSAGVNGPMSLERGVRDLGEVAKACGADVLIGHSWGGAIVIRGGLQVAAQSVIAVDPMLVQADDQWYAEFIEELDELLALNGAEREARLREDFAGWNPQDVVAKLHALHAMTTAPIAGLRDDNRDGTWDLRADIAAYTKPLLMVMAGADASIVPPEVMRDVRAHRAATVEIVTFEDQGHNLHRMAFDRFVATVDEFLSKR